MDYGKAIRFVRSARKLTQKALAQKAGIEPSYISLLENGSREPSLSAFEALASALDVPLYLLVVLASRKEDLRGVSEKQAQLIGKDLLGLLE